MREQKMVNILVSYEVITGEWSAQSVKSFSLEGKEPFDVIDAYFSEYWAGETVVDTKGRFYHHDSWEQAVKISYIRDVSNEEIELLQKLWI
jgi:hypothetical protein